jgi:glutathione peroxidase
LTSSNYKELNSLYDKHSKDLMIIGFPCNDFGSQEPGSNEEIQTFADGKGAKWKIMGKLSCQSSSSHPLFKWLQQKGDLQWNFHKYLVDKDGKLIKSYEPGTLPSAIEPDILKLLG